MAPLKAVRGVGLTPRIFQALVADSNHLEALPSEHVAAIHRHVHGNHMAEHWCPVLVENELGERWAIYMDPLEIRQHRIKVRQELFDVEEKRSRMLRRIADIRTRLPKADAVESRHCWQKEAKEAEQRRKEMLVRAFPANSRHVTVMIEVSVHMVQLELVCQHLEDELYGRLRSAKSELATLVALGSSSSELEIEVNEAGRMELSAWLRSLRQLPRSQQLYLAPRLRRCVDADALLSHGVTGALLVLCSKPVDVEESELLLRRSQWTLQLCGVLGASPEDPEALFEDLVHFCKPGSALHLWFGEPYWDAFAAARRKQLEAAAVSNGDGETVSGEMLEIRLLERIMRECYVDEQRCEEELKILDKLLAKELLEVEDVKASRRSPRKVHTPEVRGEEAAPVALGDLAEIAFSWNFAAKRA